MAHWCCVVSPAAGSTTESNLFSDEDCVFSRTLRRYRTGVPIFANRLRWISVLTESKNEKRFLLHVSDLRSVFRLQIYYRFTWGEIEAVVLRLGGRDGVEWGSFKGHTSKCGNHSTSPSIHTSKKLKIKFNRGFSTRSKIAIVKIFETYLKVIVRLIIIKTMTEIRARNVEMWISYLSLIGNGCRFYAPKAHESSYTWQMNMIYFTFLMFALFLCPFQS